MNQNRTVFDIDEETDAFYLQKTVEYHEWLIQQEAQPRLTRTPILRDREDAERRLRADYFDDHSVASQDLGFACVLWMAGANNDINVLDNFSDIRIDLVRLTYPCVSVCRRKRSSVSNGITLADGIYPEWASCRQIIHVQTDPEAYLL
ncbi:ALP1-like protein [Tanacetum coccineum]